MNDFIVNQLNKEIPDQINHTKKSLRKKLEHSEVALKESIQLLEARTLEDIIPKHTEHLSKIDSILKQM